MFMSKTYMLFKIQTLGLVMNLLQNIENMQNAKKQVCEKMDGNII